MDAPLFEFDFFVSRRGAVASAGQEVADILTAEGYRVTARDYHAVHGGNLPLSSATRWPRRILAVARGDAPPCVANPASSAAACRWRTRCSPAGVDLPTLSTGDGTAAEPAPNPNCVHSGRPLEVPGQ